MAHKPVVIAVATLFKPVVALVEKAMQGSGALVRQVDPHRDLVMKAVAGDLNALVVLHERKGETEWLELGKALHQADPHLKILAFGESADVGAVARGIVHGISNYVPLNHGASPHEMRGLIADAVAGKEVPADSVYGRVKAMLPTERDGTFRSHAGKILTAEDAIQQCISLGLTPEETAGFLGVSKAEASNLANKARRRPRVGSLMPSGRLKYATVVLVAGLALLGLTGRRKGKHFVPVSGTVTVDGAPVSNAIVYFSKEGGSHIASGKTDGAGRYRLSTLREGDGAEEGVHVVWVGVSARVGENIDINDSLYADKMAQLEEKMRVERDSGNKEKSGRIPASYRDMQSSPLRAEIKGKEPMRLDFDLKK